MKYLFLLINFSFNLFGQNCLNDESRVFHDGAIIDIEGSFETTQLDGWKFKRKYRKSNRGKIKVLLLPGFMLRGSIYDELATFSDESIELVSADIPGFSINFTSQYYYDLFVTPFSRLPSSRR